MLKTEKAVIHILPRNKMISGWFNIRGWTGGIRVKYFLVLLIGWGLTMFSGGPSLAYDLSLESVGIRGAFTISDINILRGKFSNAENESEDFQQYDVFAVLNLPWGWDFPYLYCGSTEDQDCLSSLDSGWKVRVLANASAGFLTGGGETGFITAFGPAITLRKPVWRLAIELGGGLALLSNYTYGRHDLGGPIQFVGEGAISVDLGWNLIGGLRFHHMSDAKIYGGGKHGIDLFMFELSYRFRMPLLQ